MKNDLTIVKQTLKDSKPSLVMVGGLLLFGVVFRPGFEALVMVLITILIGFEAWHVIRGNKKPDVSGFIKGLVVTFIYLWFLFALYYIAGSRGLWAVVLITILVSLVILFRNRKQYVFWIEHIEKRFLYDGKTAYERSKKK